MSCLLSLICVWAAAKQHLGWLLMASCRWCELKLLWGQWCQLCCDPGLGLGTGAEPPVCHWRAAEAQLYKACLQGRWQQQGLHTGFSKTPGILAAELWEWRALTKAFQGLFSTALLPAGSTPCLYCKPRDWGDFLYITPPALLLPMILYNFYIRWLLPVDADFLICSEF